ncbi:MAG: FAD-dependent oxidoreductase, partial [Clostridia bacterium]|nr:FAD-dependent oxidoreductase [Clostridia bacterium]
KDVLLGNVKTGKNVVVIGGGSTGCETAEKLAMDKKNVTVLELTDKLAANTGKTAQTVLMGHLKGYGANLLTECKAEKITRDSVVYTDKDGKQHKLKADTVVMAVGEKPDASLYESLKGKVKELYNIGDSNGGAILPNAVYEGYTVGNQI